MRLECAFPELDELREQIGAPLVEWDLKARIVVPDPVLEISIDPRIDRESAYTQLEHIFDNPKKLVSINGKPAVIYIPRVSEERLPFRKFHFMECPHIQMIRSEGGYERYIATNRQSGDFDLDIVFPDKVRKVTLLLSVCKSCLKAFDYRGYRRASYEKRNEIYESFDIKTFFAECTPYFDSLPTRRDSTYREDAYPVNWRDISFAYRDGVRWECERCGVVLSERHDLLEVHHKNGLKSDCRPENLIALCRECHTALHPNRPVDEQDIQDVDRLRKETEGTHPTISSRQEKRDAHAFPKDSMHRIAGLRRTVEETDPDKCFDLAIGYAKGEGVPKNQVIASEYYRKAAEKGHMSAQYNLGIRYANGRGVEKNQAKAAEWYRKAAEQGHAKAQYNLAVSYVKGHGVPQDFKLAALWYQKAAEQGVSDAQYSMSFVYEVGCGVPKSREQAIHWCKLAAEQGSSDAKVRLAKLLAEKKCVHEAANCDDTSQQAHVSGQRLRNTTSASLRPNDEEKSVLDGEAVEETDSDEHFAFSDGIVNDTRSEKDDNKTPESYQKETEQGDARSQYKLAVLYERGDGVPHDDDLAAMWYRKAAEQGLPEAQYSLSIMYETGCGVPRDRVQAVGWCRMAARQGYPDAQKRLELLLKAMNKQ